MSVSTGVQGVVRLRLTQQPAPARQTQRSIDRNAETNREI